MSVDFHLCDPLWKQAKMTWQQWVDYTNEQCNRSVLGYTYESLSNASMHYSKDLSGIEK